MAMPLPSAACGAASPYSCAAPAMASSKAQWACTTPSARGSHVSRSPPFSGRQPSSSLSSGAQARFQAQMSVAASDVGGSTAQLQLQREGEELPQGSAAITYLEGNSWFLEVGGVRFLVDPILEGPLDFGIPWLYSAFKKVLRSISVRDVADEADCLLITQSLDDHCHVNTLRPLAALRPDIPVIATPNAEPILSSLFTNVTYLEPGQSAPALGAKGAEVAVLATAGPVLGPPWQRPENGYILRGSSGGVSVYLEPHCQYVEEELQGQAPVDVVITPVVKQELPAFTLVYGQEDAVRLAKALRPRYIVPMANAELDASGVLSVLVQPKGTLDSFQKLLQEVLPWVQVKAPTPGQPLNIPTK